MSIVGNARVVTTPPPHPRKSLFIGIFPTQILSGLCDEGLLISLAGMCMSRTQDQKVDLNEELNKHAHLIQIWPINIILVIIHI